MYEEEVTEQDGVEIAAETAEIAENATEEPVYEDEVLVCRECGKEFVFTAGEKRFYAEKGFKNKPKTCKACRDARKNGEQSERTYYEAVCADCGGVAKLTFQPSDDRPVYCSACYERRRREHKGRGE